MGSHCGQAMELLVRKRSRTVEAQPAPRGGLRAGRVQRPLTCSCCRSQALGKRRELHLTSFSSSLSSWKEKTQVSLHRRLKVRSPQWAGVGHLRKDEVHCQKDRGSSTAGGTRSPLHDY